MRSALPATLPRLRRILVLSCVALGFAAGAMTGGTGAALCGLGALGVLVGRLRRGSPGATALSRWRFANAALLAGCVLAAVLGAPGLPVAMTLVCWLLVHRAFSGDGAGDDRVSLLLTLLLVLLTCILSTRALLGPLFALLALLGPASLLLCTLEVELGEGSGVEAGDGRGLGGLWALPPVALVLSAVFFVLLPRVQRTDRDGEGSSSTLAGFDEDVELGALGPILDNPDAVLRARVTDGLGQPISGPFYFRGVALDHFDGRRWQGSLGGRVDPGVPGRPDADPSAWLLQQITLEPVAEGVLFGLAPIWSVAGAGRGLTVDTSGTWRGLDEGRARSYEVLSLHPERGASALRAGGGDPWRVARGRNERAALRAGLWTDLPPGLDPRIPPLADELARQAGRVPAPCSGPATRRTGCGQLPLLHRARRPARPAAAAGLPL